MSHEHCSECGALLADREERVELTCWRCIFQRDWAHVTGHPAQRREAQRNAATQQVWQSLRHEGDVVGSHGTQEYWTCASQSEPGTRYTITRDLVSGYTHCDCTAGQYGRDCKHQAAARRYVASRAENIHKAADAAVRARQAADDRQRDTAPLRRSNRAFSLMK